MTSRTRCHQLSLELEGDSSHYLGSVCCWGHTDLFYLLVFARTAPQGGQGELGGCGRALVTCSMLGTWWGHGKRPAAFQGVGFWPHLGCCTPQVRVVLDVFGMQPPIPAVSGVSAGAVMIPGLHWGSHRRNYEALQRAGKMSESSSRAWLEPSLPIVVVWEIHKRTDGRRTKPAAF